MHKGSVKNYRKTRTDLCVAIIFCYLFCFINITISFSYNLVKYFVSLYIAFDVSMMTVSEKCIKCTKPFLNMRQKSLKCLKCLNSLHNKCSSVNKNQYLTYKNGKKDFICQYCTDYSCLKYDKHVYDRQPGILCNMYNLWIHRSWAGISKKEYEDLQNSDNDKPWIAQLQTCLMNIL